MADGGAHVRLLLILLSLVFAEWIAVSDGLIDRKRPAGRHRFFHRTDWMNFTQTVVLEQGGAGLAARHARRHSRLAMDSDAAFELKAAALALGKPAREAPCARL
jgi:hypothetical protein